MKHLLTSMLVAAMVLGTFGFAGTTAYADSDRGQGRTSFPGNSLYGRMHNPNFTYKWGGEEFNDFDELVEHVRGYLMQWRWRHGHGWRSAYERTDLYVTTESATNVDEDSAELNGEVDLGNADYADVWFEYDQSLGELDEATDKERVEGDGDFDRTVTGLEEGERYWYRAVARDDDGTTRRGSVKTFVTDGERDDEEPEADTRNTEVLDETSVELSGRINMNDYSDGIVFFVYGTDEDAVEDIADDYDTYADIEEDDEDLQKVKVDSDLDGSETYEREIDGLEPEETYYVAIGVEYEDEDGDEQLVIGDIESVTLDEDGQDEEPTVSTFSVHDITDTAAELNGLVDMQDFDDGRVFFAYATSAELMYDIEDEYDDYDELADADNVVTTIVDTDLDGTERYAEDVTSLEPDTRYYVRCGVAYEENGDEALVYGGTRSFMTD